MRRAWWAGLALLAGHAASAQSIVAGPFTNPANRHSYFVLSPTSWSQGSAAAAALGGHLATVRSAAENQFISSIVLRYDSTDRRGWIGLEDATGSGTFHWESGETPAYTNWRLGEPSFPGLNRAVEVASNTAQWNANQDDPQRSVRLQQFAQRLYRETSRCVVIGDSINSEGYFSNMPYGYHQRLRPQRWAGWVNAGYNAGSPASMVLESPVGTTGFGIKGFGPAIGGPGGPPSGGAAESNIWTCQFGDTGLWLSDPVPFDTVYGTHFSTSTRGLFAGGDWFMGAGIVRPVIYRGSLGMPQVGTVTFRNSAEVQYVAAAPLAPGYNWFDLPAGSGPGAADAWLRTAWPNANENGQNLYLLAERWYLPGVSGLELSFAGVGGSKVADHINPDRVSDDAIAAMVSALELDTVMIWLGTNDPQIDAAWNTNYRALIQRWRSAIQAAGRTPRFLLIAPYDVGNPAHANIPGYLGTIAQSAPDVSFYNLWAEAGVYAFLNATYLRDGVHPTTSGALALAGLLDDALQHAVNGDPVPAIYPIVEVSCYANCDSSSFPPLLNVNDFVCFQTRFAAGDPYANCDGSTAPPVLNVNDFICFISAFAAGCP